MSPLVRTGAGAGSLAPGDHSLQCRVRGQTATNCSPGRSNRPGLQTAGCLPCSLCLLSRAAPVAGGRPGRGHKGSSIPLHFTTRPQYYYNSTHQTTCPCSDIAREPRSFDPSVLSSSLDFRLDPWRGSMGAAPAPPSPVLIMKILSFVRLHKNVKLFKGFKHLSWKVKQNKVLRENKITCVCKLEYCCCLVQVFDEKTGGLQHEIVNNFCRISSLSLHQS